ncbi:trigger factor [Alkalicaulis satelles]|uniref:Trigger factor n=1 Tax=Alkalicaulis satelles TaxID=2609175 RepID=A0A5M6ZN48_9PROT|nr:trigger factor [Alkalicaulis satelles]KAA5805335.1 trigger factor [Alkalicaulis satelles]
MNVVEKSAEGLSRTFEVVVPAAELEAKLSAKIEEIRPEVRLKGFRPGKVPAAHIKKMFGASIMGDILQDIVPEATQKTLDERNLRPASQPNIEVKSDAEDVLKKGADFSFSIAVEVMPEFEPADPKTLSVTRPVAPVGDDQVEEALGELARQAQAYESKAKTAKAADGDKLVIDFVGSIDGEPFDGGAAEDAELVLGSGQFIPGFEDQLVGAKAGDAVEVKVNFPEDYQAAHLAGKAAVFATTVKDVQGPVESAIDDSLAERLGLENLQALKDLLVKRFENEHAQASRMKVKRALLDQLDAAHDSVDLPARMVEQEFESIWREVEQAIEAGELDDEDKDKSEDELKADYRKIAERRVRLGLVLAEIGRKARVDVTQEEIARAVNQEAARYPGQERQVVEFYQKNPGALQSLRAPIYEEKVVDYILELAEVSEEEVSRESLFSEDEPAPAPAKTKAPAKKKAPAKAKAEASGDAAPAKKAPAKKAAAKKPAAKAETAKTPAAKKPPAKKPAAKKD